MEVDESLKFHEIGWHWFQLHAQQRMQIVSFWFVAMSFLTTADVLAYVNKRYGAALIVSSGIVIASVLFLLLDRRTRELISYGERLMAAAELKLSATGPPELSIVSQMHTANRREISYRVLFTSLYGGAVLLGLVAVGALLHSL